MAPQSLDWKTIEKTISIMAEEDTPFKTAYLWGPPGIGKTWITYENIETFYAITLTEETPMCEVRGTYQLVGNEQVWVDGPALTAMREGSRLVFNEVSHAGPDMQSFMYPLLEGKGTCQLTLPTGETVRSAPGFHVIGTDNCSPTDLPEALQNRWNVKLYTNTYSPKGVAGLREPWHTLATKVSRARTLVDGRFVSLRDWYSLQNGSECGHFSLEDLCLMVFGEEGLHFHACLANYLGLEDIGKVQEAVLRGLDTSPKEPQPPHPAASGLNIATEGGM